MFININRMLVISAFGINFFETNNGGKKCILYTGVYVNQLDPFR